MPLRRALLECAVLSLQDSCVLYPSCKRCFLRVHWDLAQTRFFCSKCGSSCATDLQNYRYRLSLRAARGDSLFGLTVFGNCLNNFFGIHASGLQRLLADQTGPLETFSKSTFLVKAVEECFIGKHFIFGVKVTESDLEPWVVHPSGSKDMPQLIATQMMAPAAAGQGGCTVLTYFETIFHKAVEAKPCTVDVSKNAKIQKEPLWPMPHVSFTNIFTNQTLTFLPLSSSRSHVLDSSLSPTPPWQQTPGLITSSAEEKEKSQCNDNSPSIMEKHVQMSSPYKAWLDLTPTVPQTTALILPLINYSSPDLSNSVFIECKEEFPLSESLPEFLKDKNTPENKHQNKLLLESVDDRGQPGEACEEVESSPPESYEESGEEQAESGVYNCSADLFSSSPMINTATFDNSPFQSVSLVLPTSTGHTQTQPSVDASTPFSGKEHYFTPTNPKLEWNKHCLRESFQFMTNWDFIPSSQSTPAEKVKSVQPLFRKRNLRKCIKQNLMNDKNQASLHYCVTPTSRCKKTDQRRSSCHNPDRSLIVPPTPASPPKIPLTLESQYDYRLYEHTAEENECSTNEECDWSRDLFTDSI